MGEEIEYLHKNQTQKLVPQPKEQKVVGCKWAFKRKAGILKVEAPRYKVMLVTKGFTQRQEYKNELFSSIMKHSSIKILLVVVALYDLEFEQLHVKIAFLYCELEEQIYMSQPEGFIASHMENHVCLLQKFLYNLKQSPWQWYKRFDAFMIHNGFTRNAYDNYMYHNKLMDVFLCICC